MKNQEDKKELLSRVITFLSREELDFIDKISKDSLFTTGAKLPRAKVIEGIVDACMQMGINGENVHSKEELMNKIFEVVAKKAITGK
jgi:hypothetical protein